MSFNYKMPIIGKVISLSQDEHGPIHIIEYRKHRILSFDGHVEQSSIDLVEPQKLVHKYTQAMMTALLFCPEDPTVTLMGLGAGGMAHSLLYHFKKADIHAVEYRQKVIDAAHTYFYLPRSRRLTIHHDNAIRYMANRPVASHLIFSDLFNKQGMEPKQIQRTYLKNCRKALLPGGVLVLNLWHDDAASMRHASDILDAEFADRVMQIGVEGGNTILLAFKDSIPYFNRKTLLARASELGDKMQIALPRYTKILWELHKHQFKYAV